MKLAHRLAMIIFNRKPPRRAKRSRRRGPDRDPKYRAYIRQHPCCACGSEHRIEAAHIGPHGISQKASDYDCVPLCFRCHQGGSVSLHWIGRKRFEGLRRISFQAVIARMNEAYGVRRAA